MIPYVVLLIAYILFATRVQFWRDISTLGFKLNTPQGYMSRPSVYHALRTVLFLGAAVSPLVTGKPPLGKALLVLLAAWVFCRWYGRNDAFEEFRCTHKELLEYENEVLLRDRQEYLALLDGEDPVKRRAELEEAANMSNRQLRERLVFLRKRGL